MLDVGTGSGAVAVAVASHAAAARIHATDLSRAALAVATANAARLGLADRTAFHRADLLPEAPTRFDVVVANLPYVGADDLCEVAPDVARWEPRAAWYAGRDGLRAIRRLVARLPGRLAAGADVGIEIGWRQGPEAVALVEKAFPGARVALQEDLAGLPRLVTVEGVRDG